jgi:hypothetical protein
MEISKGFFQCSGSGIRCPFDPWIRNPGWVKVRIWIRDEQPGSYFRELRNHFLGLKYLNSLMGIQDPGWEKFGSGINIPDPQHWTFHMRVFPVKSILTLFVCAVRCGHKTPVPASQCIESLIRGGNSHHFILASQDNSLKYV